MTTFHIYMPIDAAEKNTDADLESMFDGSAQDIRQNLANMKNCGMEVIPSENCDNRDVTGRCMGHDDTSGRVI